LSDDGGLLRVRALPETTHFFIVRERKPEQAEPDLAIE